MNTDIAPGKMVIDQLSLLSAEEAKLKKLAAEKRNSNAIKMHLDEVQRKKDNLKRLAKVMGVTAESSTV